MRSNATAYRLPVSVAAGETVRFDTFLERPRLERYLDELSRQEDRLVELGEEIEGLREMLDAAERRLAEYVRALSL